MTNLTGLPLVEQTGRDVSVAAARGRYQAAPDALKVPVMNAYNGRNSFTNDSMLVVDHDGIRLVDQDEDVALKDAEMCAAPDHQPDAISFSPEKDRLVIVFDDFLDPEPTVALEEDEKIFSRTHVTLNGIRIAAVDDANALRLDHIGLMPQSFVEGSSWT